MNQSTNESQAAPPLPWIRWLKILFYSLLLLAGQALTTLLSRLYFKNGGQSKWFQSLALCTFFPLLLPPLLLLRLRRQTSSSSPPLSKLIVIFFVLGLLSASNTFFFSYAILHLPISTLCLISASQLGFNTLFSFFINAQRITHFTINTIVLQAFATIILALHDSITSNSSSAFAIVSVLAACVIYSLKLSLIELAFKKIIVQRTFDVVLQTLVCTAAVATMAITVGLVGSGEWKGVRKEMDGFKRGRTVYVMTLVLIGIGRQASNVGLLGLISEVSSLFSNVVSTLTIPLMPVLGLIFLEEEVDGTKVVSFLMTIWGLASYFYQHYLDSLNGKSEEMVRNEEIVGEENGIETSDASRKELVMNVQ